MTVKLSGQVTRCLCMVAVAGLFACGGEMPQAPNVPTGVVATPADREVTVGWDYPDRATSFTVYWANEPGVSPETGQALTKVDSPLHHQGLTNGQSYFYIVVAKNAGGASSPSVVVSAKPLAFPAAPTNVSAIAGAGTATISWDNVSDASAYDLYWSATPGVDRWDATIAEITSPYVHEGLVNGTTYYYRIGAKNALGEGPLSAEVSATPLTVPAPPENVIVYAGDGFVSVTWNPSPVAATYNLYWSITSGMGTAGIPVLDVTSGDAVTGLLNGTTYYFAVTAQNALGESEPSMEVSARPAMPVPDAPLNVTAVPGDAQVLVTWDSSPNATSYILYWSETPGEGIAGAPVTDASSGTAVTGLANGTPYYFVVTGLNAGGEGPPSLEASAIPVEPPEPPTPPQSVLAVVASGQVTLTWDPVPAATTYNIYYATASGTGTSGTRVAGHRAGRPIAGLTNGTQYFFVVTAQNAIGEGAASAEVAAVPRAASAVPSAPGGVVAHAGDRVVTITWPPVEDSTSYNVYHSAVSGTGTAGTVLTGVSSGDDVTGLTNDIEYFFVVTAQNSLGEGQPSLEVRATPRNPDVWVLKVNGGDEVTYTEARPTGASHGVDPEMTGVFDVTAASGLMPQPSTSLFFGVGYADGVWSQSLRLELDGNALGSTTIVGGDLAATYSGPSGSFVSDNGIRTTGTVQISDYGNVGDKIAGTYDLILCRTANCAAGTITLQGSFATDREPDLGTRERPKPVALGMAQPSHVDAEYGTNYYVVESTTPGTTYSIYLGAPSDDVGLQVFADDTFSTAECSATTRAEPEQCVVVASEGKMYFTAVYRGTGVGARFDIFAAAWTALPVPSGVEAWGGPSEVLVTWNPVPAANAYAVYWSTSPGVTPANGSVVGVSSPPFRHPGRVDGTRHYYVVSATRPFAGEGPVSSEVSAMPGALEAPAGFVDSTRLALGYSQATGCGAASALVRTLKIVQDSLVADVDVVVNLTHPFVQDVDLFLEYDNGVTQKCVALSTGNGGPGANYVDTQFDDEAARSIDTEVAPFVGSYKPEGSLAALDGLPMTAAWRLYSSDRFAGADDGHLNRWSLSIQYYGPPPPPPAPPQSLAATPGDRLILVTWTPVADAGSYTLYWSTSPGVTPASGNAVTEVSAPFVHSGLTNDTTYYYVLTASNAGGEGLPTVEISATPVEPTVEEYTDSPNASITDGVGNATGCGRAGARVRTITTTRTKYIHDVNAEVNINHTYDADLDIFLEFDNHGSPICVELSTDNGGGGSNFIGTIFDDEAATAITVGTAPFGGSYRPEGQLASLINVPMDGVWTLFVSDDAGGDAGALVSWSLIIDFGDPIPPVAPRHLVARGGDGKVTLSWDPSLGADHYSLYWGTAPGVAPATGTRIDDVTSPYIHLGLTNGTTYYYVATAGNFAGASLPSVQASATPAPVANFSAVVGTGIPDNGAQAATCGAAGRVVSTIDVTRTNAILDANVEVTINHTYDADLDIFLGFSNGGSPVCVELSTDNGAGGNDFSGTVFDDQAPTAITVGSAPFTGRFRPESGLATLVGLAMNGTWTLYVSDDASSDVGTLESWGLEIAY